MSCTFSSLNLDGSLVSSLSKLGIINPSPIQHNFIKSSADERSIIFQSKSGTGKTVSFCIILLNKIIIRKNSEIHNFNNENNGISKLIQYSEVLFGDVVIIVPTRELSYQIYLFFLSVCQFLEDIRPLLLTGSTNLGSVLNYMKKHNVNIVISTPGRFKTLLKSKQVKNGSHNVTPKSNVDLFKTHLLIFDEADMLLDDHFFEQTKYICTKILNPFVQLIAASATFLKPQLKLFEDTIEQIDTEYKNNFSKIYNNLTIENVGISHSDNLMLKPKILYYSFHLINTLKIKDLGGLNDYVSSFERDTIKVIFSTSYLNRIMNPVGSKEEYQIKTETTEILQGDTENNSKSLVLEKLKFYMGTVPDAPNIVIQIGLKIDVLIKVLSSVDYRKCIIFCNQSHTRIQTFKILQSMGYACYINSSRASHSERIRMLYDISSLDKVIILCTDVMSRGLGFSNVDLVINLDIPGSKEIFLHRSGRSGRFGSDGICVSICMESEIETYNYFLFSLNFDILPIENLLDSNKNTFSSLNLMKSIGFMEIGHLTDLSTHIRPTFISKVLDTQSMSQNDYESNFNISYLYSKSLKDEKKLNCNIEKLSNNLKGLEIKSNLIDKNGHIYLEEMLNYFKDKHVSHWMTLQT